MTALGAMAKVLQPWTPMTIPETLLTHALFHFTECALQVATKGTSLSETGAKLA